MALRRFAGGFCSARDLLSSSFLRSSPPAQSPCSSLKFTSPLCHSAGINGPDSVDSAHNSSLPLATTYASIPASFTRTTVRPPYQPRVRHFSTSEEPGDSPGAQPAVQYVAETWPEGVTFQTLTSQLVHITEDGSGSATGRAGLLMLCGPRLNALSNTAMREVLGTLKAWDENPEVGAMVITGSEKAFAAGADISEMKNETFVSAYNGKLLAQWEEILEVKKPIIAAVSGFALGGGCEVALMCDIILVGENAIFGQPEIKLGVLPGMGATQRLLRAVGKSRAMEMILSGSFNMDAKEAVQCGLASRLVPGGHQALLREAISLACQISAHSQPVVAMAKEAVGAAAEVGLREGLGKERNLFHAAFGLEDQKEGMNAFLEKRKPTFRNR